MNSIDDNFIKLTTKKILDFPNQHLKSIIEKLDTANFVQPRLLPPKTEDKNNHQLRLKFSGVSERKLKLKPERDLDDKNAVNSITADLGSDEASTDCFSSDRPAKTGDNPQIFCLYNNRALYTDTIFGWVFTKALYFSGVR